MPLLLVLALSLLLLGVVLLIIWLRRSSGAMKRLVPLIAALVVLLGAVAVFLNLQSKPHSEDAGMGETVSGNYTRYQGHIYINIPGQGYYLVQGADATSFSPLSEQYSSNLGKGKHAVYCGSQVIPQLQPEQVRFAQNGYVSDGTRAWYCTEEKDNPAYHWWQFFTRSNDEDSPEKPREKDYMLFELNPVHAASLKPLVGAYAEDGEHMFYEGTLIPGADGPSLRAVTRGWGHFTGREDEPYARDDHRVYYEGKPLPGAGPSAFYALVPEGDSFDNHYGQDTATGQFYFGAQPFPGKVDGVDSSGLHMLIADRERSNHELFYNSSGIWYWEYQEGKLKRGCTNPFHAASMSNGAPVELSPGVWADAHDTFVLRAGEAWGHSRNDPSLRTRTTQLWMLPGLARAQWSKVADIPGNDGIGTEGTLWRAGSQLYFAPFAGQSNFFNDALYLVSNLDGLKRDIVSDQNASQADDERLKVLDANDIQEFDSSNATLVCRMTSRYPAMWEIWK